MNWLPGIVLVLGIAGCVYVMAHALTLALWVARGLGG